MHRRLSSNGASFPSCDRIEEANNWKETTAPRFDKINRGVKLMAWSGTVVGRNEAVRQRPDQVGTIKFTPHAPQRLFGNDFVCVAQRGSTRIGFWVREGIDGRSVRST